MNYFEIPLEPKAQTFRVTILSVTYQFTLQWRLTAWYLDIVSDVGEKLLSGVPLLTGSNLLSQYRYLGFDFALFVLASGSDDSDPTYESLGSTHRLYFATS